MPLLCSVAAGMAITNRRQSIFAGAALPEASPGREPQLPEDSAIASARHAEGRPQGSAAGGTSAEHSASRASSSPPGHEDVDRRGMPAGGGSTRAEAARRRPPGSIIRATSSNVLAAGRSRPSRNWTGK